MLNNYSNFNPMVKKCPKSKVLLSCCGTLYIIYMPKLPFHEGALLQVETEFPRQANFGILSQGVQHVTQYAV